jgi:hypothetical protein
MAQDEGRACHEWDTGCSSTQPDGSTVRAVGPASVHTSIGSPWRRCSQSHRHWREGASHWWRSRIVAGPTGVTRWTPTPCSSSFSSCCSSAAAASSTVGVAYDLPTTPGLPRDAERPRVAQGPHDRAPDGSDRRASRRTSRSRSTCRRGAGHDGDPRLCQAPGHSARPHRSRTVTRGPSRSLGRLRGAPDGQATRARVLVHS